MGGNDAFFAKYDANGNYLWAKNIGSSNGDFANNIACNEEGVCYIVGYYQGVADFDPGSGTAYLTPAGAADVFFAKYSTVPVIVNESDNQTLINVFPIPTSSNLTIQTTEKATIEISNIQGQLLKTINTAEKQTLT